MIIGGAILAVVINFFLLENVFIPDPCYYHIHEPGRLFWVFHDLSDGGHPFPTTFNFIFTILIGGLLGWIIGKRLARESKT